MRGVFDLKREDFSQRLDMIDPFDPSSARQHMGKAVFTTSESSAYDDQPELRYHFPKRYLERATSAIGNLIVYYEPRRTTGTSSVTGRQAYFAVARLDRIESDPALSDHYYGYVSNYVELDRPVAFRVGSMYFESALMKVDGSTNRGAFGNSVRPIADEEFSAILAAGFARTPESWEPEYRVAESVPEYVERSLVTQVVTRKFRDEAFRRHVRSAYANTCAITGLKLINGGGRPEVQAAHIRPVEVDGPDTVRNGLALTGTIHWLFDRGLISIDDSFRVLISSHGLPDSLNRLIPQERTLRLPDRNDLRPHPTYLAWHRINVFKG